MSSTVSGPTFSGPIFSRKAFRLLAIAGLFVVALAVAATVGLLRQPRQYRVDPPVSAALEGLRLMPNGIAGSPPEVYFALGQPYEETAYDLNQGKRLYSWFGCASCHGDGEGGAGPSFLDGWWLYGPSMVSIAASIRDGRPHGMPAFRHKMTIDEIWQLAGYVKAIGAYSAKLTAPSRSDDRQTRPAENRAPAAILFDQGSAPVRRPKQGPSP
ncbi:c-type cytochrome [Mesorhizobium sp.]|uniref:c-type cytochrome n=1 Tax=Mesorhizobium sp. TaxID=1871066 RepID=UPI000FE60E71|nr:c-type cytochrome [Mesorhizobium sp.]RWK63163.1 MAG: cytochrome C oxidase subunit III [Mesorhizobium sp.]RWM50189.1 MAG: cytochrome C oxidase subunit III [Mesorhizobium sp.]RWM57069.1 MAG: cytochrome C oxidase subunit III [Mesorhizobium sp.]RWM58441.1 MAG: cytochrome C oxidase subunit III [Mesorhizobium sp.]RWN04468.1 MAG: cytochrome C oxidase subunit III [Mesorhizobium sp.]